MPAKTNLRLVKPATQNEQLPRDGSRTASCAAEST